MWEVELDANLSNDLAIVSYLIEDSIVGDQKMPDNTHNSSYAIRASLNEETYILAREEKLSTIITKNNKH